MFVNKGYHLKRKHDWPGLGLSKMQVVDAVEVHVLSVPGKCGLPHAKVHIGGVHTFDDDSTLLLHHIQQCVQMANIPLLDVLNRDKMNVLCYLHKLKISTYDKC